MKETIIICVSLALVFVPSFIFKNYLEKTGKDVLQILESMNDDIKNEANPDEEKSKVLEKVYLEKEKKWILIVDHDILDEIEDGIAECIAYYNDEEGELVRMNDTIYTDSGGEFVSQMMRDGWVDTKKLIFNDIDGEANGGTFKSDSVCMKDMESKQIKKGDGNWYLGTYEYNMEIKLSKEDK